MPKVFIVVFKEEHVTWRTTRVNAIDAVDAQRQALEQLETVGFHRLPVSATKDTTSIDKIDEAGQ